MKTLFLTLLFLTALTMDIPKIDFGKQKDGRNWQVVNDGVMGGLSQGSAQLTDDSILFKGKVSLDNNGGFSSLRSNFSRKELTSYEQVKIRYRSDGISLAMTLSVSRRWYIPNYKTSLASTGGTWKTITLNLKDFRKHYIGKPMNETLDSNALGEVIRLGFITDEKKYGDFEFEIDYIEFM
jgi:monofunctional biosynthetic peptidoglycan transglycosylase